MRLSTLGKWALTLSSIYKKEYTDASYIACAKLMLENNDYIYPQFATHNALTVFGDNTMVGNKPYEFQKAYMVWVIYYILS